MLASSVLLLIKVQFGCVLCSTAPTYLNLVRLTPYNCMFSRRLTYNYKINVPTMFCHHQLEAGSTEHAMDIACSTEN